MYYNYESNLENVSVDTEEEKQTVFDPFESKKDIETLESEKISKAWEKENAEEMKKKQIENEEIERRWRQELEAEELLRERQRRETDRRQRGSVEFVHPDLKNELKKQGEDPNNPWVWLTSYSRIPVSLL